MDSSHSKEGFIEGLVKKKGLGLFWGNKEMTIMEYKKRNNTIKINIYVVNLNISLQFA